MRSSPRLPNGFRVFFVDRVDEQRLLRGVLYRTDRMREGHALRSERWRVRRRPVRRLGQLVGVRGARARSAKRDRFERAAGPWLPWSRAVAPPRPPDRLLTE